MSEMDVRSAWDAYAGMVFRPGALSVKEKRLVGYAVAHLTRCGTCLEEQKEAASAAGATDSELEEVRFVAMRAAMGAPYAFSSIAFEVKNDLLSGRDLQVGHFFKKNITPEIEEFRSLQGSSPEFGRFHDIVYADGALPASFKRGLLAMALAHFTRCPYCIRTTTRDGHAMGVEKQSMAEAIDVVMYMAADPCYARGSVPAACGLAEEAAHQMPNAPTSDCGC